MKLFIWDDRNYQLIEEGDDYDEKNYTVVRKLFVRYNVSSRKFLFWLGVLRVLEREKGRFLFKVANFSFFIRKFHFY